jgi:Glycosyl transferase WecG/TagA/CpsF family
MALHRHHHRLTFAHTRSVLDCLVQVVDIAGPTPVGAEVLLRVGDGQPRSLGDRGRVLTVVVGQPQVVTGLRRRTVEVVLPRTWLLGRGRGRVSGQGHRRDWHADTVRRDPEPSERALRGMAALNPGRDLVVGVGGSFDVVAGKIARAPCAMQPIWLQWFWRLLEEPQGSRHGAIIRECSRRDSTSQRRQWPVQRWRIWSSNNCSQGSEQRLWPMRGALETHDSRRPPAHGWTAKSH